MEPLLLSIETSGLGMDKDETEFVDVFSVPNQKLSSLWMVISTFLLESDKNTRMLSDAQCKQAHLSPYTNCAVLASVRYEVLLPLEKN